MSNKRQKRIKKITIVLLSALLIFMQSPVVLAQTVLTAPEAPTAPTPPPQPEDPEEPPAEPTPPPEPSPPPPAPTPPEAPTLEDALNPTPTPEVSVDSSQNEGDSTASNTSSTGSTDAQSNDSSGQEPIVSLGQTADGQTGDTEIETGDATSTASIVTNANTNTSAVTGGESGGVQVVNQDNGSGSDNTGSVTIVDDNTTVQDNSAKIINNLNQDSSTGSNSTSKNVGDSSIETGDANTTGTIVNAVNTNIDGVMVSEFNVIDDHLGDIILDFGASCISGCGGGVLVENSGNGSDSTNTGEVDSVANNNTFQNNDATVENNMTLASDSGNNLADKNTGGDSSIETGDANVSANVLNFVNNNLAGNVIYAVINIFGDLIGDIIFPDGACCFGNATAANSGNGSDSTNTASIDQTTTDNTFQFNEANIENNLVFDANTGANVTSKNTDGDSSIETGDATIDAQVVNIANTNIDGGDWWLVIVNDAGRWIGRILGAPEGSFLAGSEGFEFEVNENGEITVVNSGNGSGSTNTGSVSQETNNTLVQTNTANIVNNINLSANTGGNSASKNTGGDSSIETGDANIIANIVNFVNNNIAGGGRLFVNVINVFGSWIGDFVGPGYSKENDALAMAAGANSEQEIGGTSDIGGSSDNSQSDSGGAGGDDGAGNNGSSSTSGSDSGSTSSAGSGSSFEITSNVLASGVGNKDYLGGTEDGMGMVLGASSDNSSVETAGNRVIKINLAWLIFLLPPVALLVIRKRRKALVKAKAT